MTEIDEIRAAVEAGGYTDEGTIRVLLGAIEAVCSLHSPNNLLNPPWCSMCDHPWPCPTIDAIGGSA